MNTEDVVALAIECAELATAIRRDSESESQWTRICGLAVRHVAGCTWASVSDLKSGTGRSIGASDPIAEQLDCLQHDLGIGPCVQSATMATSVLCNDVRTEQRWMPFLALARKQTPLHSVLAVHLPGRDLAALNFYADRVDAFDDDSVTTASILAAHVASLITVAESAEKTRHLTVALATNRQIGIAIGVLMALYKIHQGTAFDLLKAASQSLNRKLRDVAVEVIETGALPKLPEPLRAPGRRRTRRDDSAHLAGSDDWTG